MRFSFYVLPFLLLSACATPVTQSPDIDIAEVEREKAIQREMVVEQRVIEEERVLRLAYPIFKNSAELCENTRLTVGGYLLNANSFAPEYQTAAKKILNVGSDVTIWTAYKGSPLAKAGLKKGDRIIGVNGKQISSGAKAFRELSETLRKDEEPVVHIDYVRGDEPKKTKVTREKVCDYDVIYEPSKEEVNAYADGASIHITRGMERFSRDDNELALVIAHELAHNTMGHVDKKRSNAMVAGAGGLALDILAAVVGVNTGGSFTDMASGMGANAYSQGFEAEADYAGMYYLARGGYKTDKVAYFWRRMAAENDARSIKTTHTSSHPSSPERFLAIEKAHKEITRKRNLKLPLEPNITKVEEKNKKVRPEYPD